MDKQLITNLCTANSLSAHETQVKDILVKELENIVDEISFDNIGSLICKINLGTPGKKVAVVAHMDEVGLVVRYITPEGFVGFIASGGLDPTILLGQRVIANGNYGVVVKSADTNDKLSINDLVVDFGCSSISSLEALGIIQGTPIYFDSQIVELGDNKMMSKAFDNRLGCGLIVELAKQLKTTNTTGCVYLCASVQEEVGIRGAVTLGNKLPQDLDNVLVIDVSPTNEIIDPKSVKSGEGPLIRVKDPRMVFNYDEVNVLRNLAKENNIKYQSFFSTGGTDAINLELAGDGNVVAALCVAGRNLHSHNTIIDINDYDATLKLASLYITNKLRG